MSERGDGESDDPALTLRLVESCTTSVAAYHGLWSYLLGLDPAGEILTGQRPLDEPLRHLLADPRALRVASVADRTWLRLLEVAPALRARRYARPGSVALEVGDETCRWNEGRYELLVDPIGRAEVWGPLLRSEGSGEQVTLRLDAAALAAAYLGGTSFGELASAGRVIADRPESVVEADALFCFGPAPFCTAEL